MCCNRHSKSVDEDKYKHPKPELSLKENLELSSVDHQNVSVKQDDSKGIIECFLTPLYQNNLLSTCTTFQLPQSLSFHQTSSQQRERWSTSE